MTYSASRKEFRPYPLGARLILVCSISLIQCGAAWYVEEDIRMIFIRLIVQYVRTVYSWWYLHFAAAKVNDVLRQACEILSSIGPRPPLPMLPKKPMSYLYILGWGEVFISPFIRGRGTWPNPPLASTENKWNSSRGGEGRLDWRHSRMLGAILCRVVHQ